MSDEDLRASVAAGRQAVSTVQMAKAWTKHFQPLMVTPLSWPLRH
jgi:hypothetical protein